MLRFEFPFIQKILRRLSASRSIINIHIRKSELIVLETEQDNWTGMLNWKTRNQDRNIVVLKDKCPNARRKDAEQLFGDLTSLVQVRNGVLM